MHSATEEVIRVAGGTGSLRIEAPAGAPIRGGVHGPFFEVVLGFARTEFGYELRDVSRPQDALRDVVEYLTEQGLQFELDPAAARLLERVRLAADELANALAAGERVRGEPAERPALPGFARPLFEHQWRPVRHLLEVPHAANFSVMGSGKTTVVIAAFQELRRRGVVEKLLVIGPGSCFWPWEDEYRECLGQPPVVRRLVGPAGERPLLFRETGDADLLLITYHTAAREERNLVALLRQFRTMLVLDESHYVKGTGVIAEAVVRIAAEAERRVVLTGTPAPNSYEDLWTQFTFLWPDQHLLGSRVAYRALLGTPDGERQAVARVRPLFTRVRKSDLGLPAPRFRPVEVELLPIQRRIYEALSARTLQELNLQPIDRAQLRVWRRAKMVRLIQGASNPALIAGGSIEFSLPPEDALGVPLLSLIESYPRYEVAPKLLAAVELASRLVGQGEQVIIWTHFVENIRILLPYLAEFDVLPLYGAVPRGEEEDEDYNRELHIRRFKDPADPCVVLVANPGAAGESVSLHRVCHHAVYLDRTFNAGQFMQSRDRIHRVGLRPDELVTYHLLIARGTVDEVVHTRLQAKEQRMLQLLDDADVPVIDLPVTTDELSGSEDEEALDFAAVIEHLRQTTRRT